MSIQVRSATLPAATGAVFALVLTLANGQGGQLSDPRDVAASAALTLLMPFVVYVATVLRARARSTLDNWLAGTALATGTAGAAVKLASGAPEIAASHTAGLSAESSRLLTATGDALTLLALFPLAVFCLAVGAHAWRTRVLPPWLSVGALTSGAALAVNGCFRGTETVPALLVMALWCLLASLHLTVASVRTHESITAPRHG